MKNSAAQPVYFIGIALPPEHDRVVSKLQWQIHEQDTHTLKPILPHITLLHPPSLNGIMPNDLLPRVHEIAQRYLPLTLAIQSIGFFGKTVCYLEVQSHSMYSLQAQLVRLLPPESQALHYKRPYLPHITVAQAYEPNALDKSYITEILTDTLTLPQQLTISSISYFKRILPRQYRAKSL